MVDYLVPGAVVVVGQPPLGDGHADPVGKTLAQGPCGHLPSGGQPVLRVAGRRAAPLPELFRFFQRQVITGEVDQGIQQSRGVAR